VFFHAGGDGEDVQVEDHVLRRKPHFLRENVIRTSADLDLPLVAFGLAVFVERHHDSSRPVSPDDADPLPEELRTILKADRIDDPLSLQTLQTRLNDGPP